jgi:hypothetical protein
MGHVDMGNAYKIIIENPEGDSHYRDLRLDGRITLKCILQKE